MSSSQEWKVAENGDCTDAFHYTSCGLDGIYLIGGFTRHKTNYGDGVSIADVEGLHRAIGERLVSEERTLVGSEIRFLRKEMKLTQAELAAVLRVNVQAVARWEKNQNRISGPGEVLLRALFKQSIGTEPNLRSISRHIHPGVRNVAPSLMFEPGFGTVAC